MMIWKHALDAQGFAIQDTTYYTGVESGRRAMFYDIIYPYASNLDILCAVND